MRLPSPLIRVSVIIVFVSLTTDLVGNTIDRSDVGIVTQSDTAAHFQTAEEENTIAIELRENGRPEEGLERSEYALTLNPDSLEKASIYNNMGACQRALGEYNEAIENYIEALKIYDHLGDELNAATVNNNIGVLYMYLNMYDRARKYYHKARKIYELNSDQPGLARTYNNLAIVWSYADSLAKSLDYFRLSLNMERELGNITGIAECYNNIGSVHFMNSSHDSAHHYFLQTLSIEQARGDVEGQATTYNNLGQNLIVAQQLEEAKPYIDSGYHYAQQAGTVYDIEAALLNYTDYYQYINDFESALDSYITYSEFKDSVLEENNIAALEELEVRYNSAQLEKDAVKARQEKAEADLVISQRNKWIIGLTGGALSILLLALLVIQRNKKRAKAERDAQRIELTERGLKAVIEGQEEERARVARELHDGVVQEVASVIMRWRKLNEQPEGNRDATHLIDMLTDVNTDLRTLSHRMMPRSLAELGIIAALDDLLEASLQSTGINYLFEHFGIDERLPQKIEVTIYRIAQELLQNIIKHSGAKNVNVQLFKAQGMFILIVEDDGIGLRESTENSGIGLLNISSRLNTVNGDVNFEPSAQSGTLVTIRIPEQ